ncbi:uncharacterized protein [Rutidosis leptorrhynchoides]|uniref:uncharacterized protein n=1 Tax=Rutidosis leptorrhynchoides TaxID=125765 RepID=UPI003A9A4CF5
MRIASWNTRGLGNKSRGRTAGNLVNRFQLQFIAIQETMVQEVSKPTLNKVWKHFNYDSIQVKATGRSGGLVSIWRTDFFTLITSLQKKHWIAIVLRSQLTKIALNWPRPLCFLGNFNSVCSPKERLREAIDVNAISPFNYFIVNAKLIDQQLVNDEFTWEGPLEKFSRIDKVFLNSLWTNLWPVAILQTDHPDNKWAEYDTIGWAAFVLNKNLRLLKADLKAWSVANPDSAIFDLRFCESEICRLEKLYRQSDLSQVELIELVNLKKCKKRLMIKIESKQRLHSRVQWLKLGDKNSRFFHLVSRIKQQSSYIAGMQINNQ